MPEQCAICGCKLNHGLNYGKDTAEGRSHATEHHYVPKRFFGHPANQKRVERTPIFMKCLWKLKRKTEIFCYDCHEELLHNPVLLLQDISRFAELIRARDLNENNKTIRKDKLAGRIILLHEVIELGIDRLLGPTS